eukprot:gene21549-28542_t
MTEPTTGPTRPLSPIVGTNSFLQDDSSSLSATPSPTISHSSSSTRKPRPLSVAIPSPAPLGDISLVKASPSVQQQIEAETSAQDVARLESLLSPSTRAAGNRAAAECKSVLQDILLNPTFKTNEAAYFQEAALQHDDLMKQLAAGMAMLGFHPAYTDTPDMDTAIQCLERAANMGSSFAAIQLGNLLMEMNTFKDQKAAIACELGYHSLIRCCKMHLRLALTWPWASALCLGMMYSAADGRFEWLICLINACGYWAYEAHDGVNDLNAAEYWAPQSTGHTKYWAHQSTGHTRGQPSLHAEPGPAQGTAPEPAQRTTGPAQRTQTSQRTAPGAAQRHAPEPSAGTAPEPSPTHSTRAQTTEEAPEPSQRTAPDGPSPEEHSPTRRTAPGPDQRIGTRAHSTENRNKETQKRKPQQEKNRRTHKSQHSETKNEHHPIETKQRTSKIKSNKPALALGDPGTPTLLEHIHKQRHLAMYPMGDPGAANPRTPSANTPRQVLLSPRTQAMSPRHMHSPRSLLSPRASAHAPAPSPRWPLAASSRRHTHSDTSSPHSNRPSHSPKGSTATTYAGGGHSFSTPSSTRSSRSYKKQFSPSYAAPRSTSIHSSGIPRSVSGSPSSESQQVVQLSPVKGLQSRLSLTSPGSAPASRQLVFPSAVDPTTELSARGSISPVSPSSRLYSPTMSYDPSSLGSVPEGKLSMESAAASAVKAIDSQAQADAATAQADHATAAAATATSMAAAATAAIAATLAAEIAAQSPPWSVSGSEEDSGSTDSTDSTDSSDDDDDDDDDLSSVSGSAAVTGAPAAGQASSSAGSSGTARPRTLGLPSFPGSPKASASNPDATKQGEDTGSPGSVVGEEISFSQFQVHGVSGTTPRVMGNSSGSAGVRLKPTPAPWDGPEEERVTASMKLTPAVAGGGSEEDRETASLKSTPAVTAGGKEGLGQRGEGGSGNDDGQGGGSSSRGQDRRGHCGAEQGGQEGADRERGSTGAVQASYGLTESDGSLIERLNSSSSQPLSAAKGVLPGTTLPNGTLGSATKGVLPETTLPNATLGSATKGVLPETTLPNGTLGSVTSSGTLFPKELVPLSSKGKVANKVQGKVTSPRCLPSLFASCTGQSNTK